MYSQHRQAGISWSLKLYNTFVFNKILTSKDNQKTQFKLWQELQFIRSKAIHLFFHLAAVTKTSCRKCMFISSPCRSVTVSTFSLTKHCLCKVAFIAQFSWRSGQLEINFHSGSFIKHPSYWHRYMYSHGHSKHIATTVLPCFSLDLCCDAETFGDHDISQIWFVFLWMIPLMLHAGCL